MKKHPLQQFINRAPVALALCGATLAAQAGPVQAPPLPPGSDRVYVEVGLSPDEVARHRRAHKHPRLERKDPTRDDSLTEKAGSASTQAVVPAPQPKTK